MKKTDKPKVNDQPEFTEDEKKFLTVLKPILNEAIDVKLDQKISGVQLQISELKKTFIQEFKNLQKNSSTPSVAQQQNGQQPNQLNGILEQLSKDPQMGGIIKSLQNNQVPSMGGSPPQGGQPSFNPMQMMLPPNYADLDKDQKLMVWQQMNGQMLMMQLLPVLMPMITGQSEGAQGLMQIYQRQMFDNISYNAHMNRGIMQYMVKKGIVDPEIGGGYQAASLNYLSPISDPQLYNQNMPQNPQQYQQAVAQQQQQNAQQEKKDGS